jgi:hypothetical protein
MRSALGRLPLKPSKPRLISATDQPIGQVQGLQLPGPTVREHGGVPAPRAPDGRLLPPEAKWRRLRHQPMDVAPSDPTSVMEWPPSPPLVLSESQSEDLGTYIKRDSRRLERVGFSQLVEEQRQRSDFSSGVRQIPHKAARLLDHLRKRGANVSLKPPPLTDGARDEKMQREPHKSAVAHADFLREELLNSVRKGFWMVLPYKLLKKYKKLLRNMRISPMGVVPQQARQPRIIVDYSFFGLNDDTIKTAPRDAMQFGKALKRILQAIVDANPDYGPVHLIKVDIADGFYRIWVNGDDITKLVVALPPLGSTEPLVALPLVLPMGWTESPPYFCAATETVTNMTNWRLMNRWKAPPHRLEALANTRPPPEAKGDGTLTSPVAEGPKPPLNGIPMSPFAKAEGPKPLFAGSPTSPFAEGPKPPFATSRRRPGHTFRRRRSPKVRSRPSPSRRRPGHTTEGPASTPYKRWISSSTTSLGLGKVTRPRSTTYVAGSCTHSMKSFGGWTPSTGHIARSRHLPRSCDRATLFGKPGSSSWDGSSTPSA